jgi:hypothetical protein
MNDTWLIQRLNKPIPEKFRKSDNPLAKAHSDTQGWLELNNGFFFFIDETMWKSTAALFRQKVAA